MLLTATKVLSAASCPAIHGCGQLESIINFQPFSIHDVPSNYYHPPLCFRTLKHVQCIPVFIEGCTFIAISLKYDYLNLYLVHLTLSWWNYFCCTVTNISFLNKRWVASYQNGGRSLDDGRITWIMTLMCYYIIISHTHKNSITMDLIRRLR